MKWKDKPLPQDFLEYAGRKRHMTDLIISAVDARRGTNPHNDIYPGVIKTPSGFRCTRKRVDMDREYIHVETLKEALEWVHCL